MAHARATLRQAVVALLLAGRTDAGDRVFDHPHDPRRSFPALTVEDAGEQQAPQTMPAGPSRVLGRVYAFDVTAEVQQIEGYAAQRDTLLAQVEVLLSAAGLAGVKSITPTVYQPAEDHAGERPIAVGRQRFEALYYTTQGNPAATL